MSFKISFIGAGNVAWHIAKALENAGNSVQEVFSREPSKAKDLVSYLYNAKVHEDLDFSESVSAVFFLCVPESAYPEVLKELLLPKYATLILVTGTFSLAEANLLYDPARESTNQMGVFFPVQHLESGRRIKLDQMPICLEVLVEETQNTLVALAKDITDAMYLVNGEERKKIHKAMLLAGVLTQNLWSHAQELLQSIELEPSLLHGLVQQHVQAFFSGSPLSKEILDPHLREVNFQINQILERNLI